MYLAPTDCGVLSTPLLSYLKHRNRNMLQQHAWTLFLYLVYHLFSTPFRPPCCSHAGPDPVIIVTLLRLKVPGNSSSLSQVIRLRKRNIHLTKMFISIIVPLLVTNGTFQLAFVIRRFSLLSNLCISQLLLDTVYPFPNIFHAVNPVIYFIFCSSYRQGLKQIFSCCCRRSTVGSIPPGRKQIQLKIVPQQRS